MKIALLPSMPCRPHGARRAAPRPGRLPPTRGGALSSWADQIDRGIDRGRDGPLAGRQRPTWNSKALCRCTVQRRAGRGSAITPAAPGATARLRDAIVVDFRSLSGAGRTVAPLAGQHRARRWRGFIGGGGGYRGGRRRRRIGWRDQPSQSVTQWSRRSAGADRTWTVTIKRRADQTALWEGQGAQAWSTLRKPDIATRAVARRSELAAAVFTGFPGRVGAHYRGEMTSLISINAAFDSGNIRLMRHRRRHRIDLDIVDRSRTPISTNGSISAPPGSAAGRTITMRHDERRRVGVSGRMAGVSSARASGRPRIEWRTVDTRYRGMACCRSTGTVDSDTGLVRLFRALQRWSGMPAARRPLRRRTPGFAHRELGHQRSTASSIDYPVYRSAPGHEADLVLRPPASRRIDVRMVHGRADGAPRRPGRSAHPDAARQGDFPRASPT